MFGGEGFWEYRTCDIGFGIGCGVWIAVCVLVFGLVVEVLGFFFSLGQPIFRCLPTFSEKDDTISSICKVGY